MGAQDDLDDKHKQQEIFRDRVKRQAAKGKKRKPDRAPLGYGLIGLGGLLSFLAPLGLNDPSPDVKLGLAVSGGFSMFLGAFVVWFDRMQHS